jgi:hypothetical protein
MAPCSIPTPSSTSTNAAHGLQRMDDTALERFGKAAAYMASPAANLGRPPREPFLVQLREARVEWKRRLPRRDPCQ